MLDRVGQYQIRSQLGQGAMGVVYEAFDTRLQRTVALKFLSAGDRNSEPLADLLEEARAAAGLNHPAICTIYEVGEDAGRVFLAMELVRGKTLAEMLADGPLPPARAVDLVLEVGQGLAFAHANGVRHGDIKPENIMVSEEGQARIMDFGLARKPVGDVAPEMEGFCGTPAYMAPEQLLGGEVGPPADVWALGLVLLECLTGDNPFREGYSAATIYKVLHDGLPTPADYPRLPANLLDIILETLQRDPAARTDSAEEFVRQLQAWREVGAPQSRRPGPRAGLGVVAGILVLLAGVWGLARLGGGPAPEENPSLAVLGFAAAPAAAAGSTLGLSELINIGLIENGPVRVISPEYLADLERRMDESGSSLDGSSRAMEVARRAHATFVLTGDVQNKEGRHQVIWRLVCAADGRTLVGRRTEGADAALIVDGILQSVVPALAEAVGADLKALPRTVREMTTESPLAYRHYAAGIVARQDDRFQDAIAELEAAVAADSSFALACFELSRVHGNIYGGIGNPQATAVWMERAWENRSRLCLRDRLRLEAWRLRNHLDFADARLTLEEIITRWPDDRRALLELMELLWHHWHFQEALDVARQGALLFADDLEYLTTIHQCLENLGQLEDAVPIAERCTELDPENPNLWHQLCAVYLRVHRPGSAEAAARRALVLDPDFLLGKIDVAACTYARGELDSAIAQLEAICAADTFPATRIRVMTSDSFRPALTLLYQDAGRPSAVLDLFRRARGAASGLAIAGRRARTQVHLGQCRAALAWSDSILAANQDLGSWFNATLFRPAALARTGRLVEARQAVDELLGSVDKIGGLARFFALTGSIAVELAAGDAHQAWARVLEVEANGFPGGGRFEIEFLEGKAAVLEALGRPEEAGSVLQELVRTYPGRTQARFRLAGLLQAAGRDDAARRHFARCRRLWQGAEADYAPARELAAVMAGATGTLPEAPE